MEMRTYACALAAWFLIAVNAMGQWAAQPLHPSGQSSSGAFAIDEDVFGPWPRPIIAGYAQSADVLAGTWAFSFPYMFASVHPAGWDDSQCLDVQGGQSVGTTASGVGFDIFRAALWHGDPAMYVNLHPDGALASAAMSVYEGQQAGFARYASGDRAGFWMGEPASWTELHPAEAVESEAWAAGADADGPVQAGWVQYEEDAARAALWRGTPESLSSLHPVGFDQSWINAVGDDLQVGVVAVSGFRTLRAAMWRGTADSFLSLHPAWAEDSIAYGVWGRYQVGMARDSVTSRAMLWRSRIDRVEDLHEILPSRFEHSEARGVWSDGRSIFVAGFGYTASGAEALLWSRAVSCDVDLDGDGELTVFDFLTFQNLFLAGDYHADFDGDGELTLFDFLAFQREFALGC
ncbi:MAG: hypothetical protein NCW75_14580 [Phycisphaera sp.]|nr:MAG: hypothetical protein NCW75_14580 [Phycisphaera sp.]